MRRRGSSIAPRGPPAPAAIAGGEAADREPRRPVNVPPPTRPAALTVALQLLGAVAGLTAVITFVGGAMLWIRFSELNLPADQALNLLPKQLLLVVGAHSLAAPVCLGLVSALAFLLFNPYRNGAARPIAFPLGVLVPVVPAALAAAVLVEDFDVWPEGVIMALALALAIAAVLVVAQAKAGPVRMATVLFAAFVLCGAVLAVVRTLGEPSMEPVAVALSGKPDGVGGFYIGQTSDRLYVAPLPGTGDPGDPFADADVDRILEIKRDQVLQMAFREPTGIRSDQAGREQAQSLLEELRALRAGGPAPGGDQTVITADPVTAFAPLVHLHSRETAWPMSAEEFLAHSQLRWAHDDGCPHWSAATERHEPPPKEALGRFDHARLAGSGAYTHAGAARDCDEDGQTTTTAGAHTRPYDEKGRARGVELKEGFYLDVANEQRNGTARVRRRGAQKVFERVPAYYERDAERVEGRPGVRITYWLFYGLSRPPGASAGTKYLIHEGDWERISVLLARGKRANEYLPASVRYHAHDGSRDVAWGAVKRVGTGGSEASTHPVVFSAKGSHASYWRAGTYENVFSVAGRRRFAVYDSAIACPDCPQWRTWEMLLDARSQPWYGFGGAWGGVGSMTGTTGPLGPSSYKSGGLSPGPAKTVRQAPAAIATPTPTPTLTAIPTR